ncbi:serine/threonine-protein kinase Nek8-like [Acanthaster planci]|uniref:Serine/threonine-protein kinase Nek8 n=1 Tax=Acanthaster planci TaxID=133434 RepID=A0A8B7YG67_ACAPL|nr:serine/threonine-protein kinase Nek8-like [Acanthaster planci]
MDKYEKIRVVGRGAYGTVYLCRRLSDQELVIIKQIPVEQMTGEERQVAVNESKVLAMLDHPNIIKYYENFLEDKALSIVMEYAEGGTLFDYLQHRGSALLEEGEVLRLFCQLLLSLQHVHSKQILHRDLKTQNILLNKRRDVLKIADFGISKILSSKSKAFTVVGTPCYISPELCEGKPYNQKSDIWAVGCVLYELLTFKRAFEADNLPALVMKIMRGFIAPISDRYSDELKRLLLQMLHLDPDKRPSINQVIAEPIIIKMLANVYMEIGRVKCPLKIPKPFVVSSSSVNSKVQNQKNSKKSLSRKSSSVVLDSSTSNVPKLRPLSTVSFWGHGVITPVRLPLPHSDTQIVQVATGRTQKVAVTKNGRLIIWEFSSVGADSTMLPGAVDQQYPTFIPRYLEGQSAVTIQHVSCGDMFTACLTDRGILMTYGSGAHGSLGHGNYHDVSQAKIVEELLGYEVVMVSCGASHVMAVTTDNEVFSWGRGDNGRLGLDSQESFPSPQSVSLPAVCHIASVHCGLDCSLLLTTDKKVLACGSNRYNKLGLDDVGPNTKTRVKVDEMHTYTLVASHPIHQLPVRSVAIGTAHAAMVTDDNVCFTLGSNQFGQLGCETETNSPRIPCSPVFHEDVAITAVACGDMFTVALASDGQVFSWGKSSRGRLGRLEDHSAIPQKVDLNEEEPFVITSVSCNHGNTLLATRSRVSEADTP